ncbi:MAG TPA: hypothetical protein PLJ43_13570, partial [Chitinophagales bacterium]|nr:hypothetical protein [Chitinophagales bacterium]
EQILITETNKLLRKEATKKVTPEDKATVEALDYTPPAKEQPLFTFHLDTPQERDIVRLLLENSNYEIEGENAIARILRNLSDVEIDHPEYNMIIEEYRNAFAQNEFLTQAHFFNHPDEAIRNLTIDLLQSPYELSDNWTKMHDVPITDKQFLVRKDIVKSISLLKLKKIIRMKQDVDNRIKELQHDTSENGIQETMLCQKESIQLQQFIRKLSTDTGTVVLPGIL